MTGRIITLGAGAPPVGLADMVVASGPDVTVHLTNGTWALVERSRAVVEAYAAREAAVYGLTTGLGGNLGHRIDRAEIQAFQPQIVRGRMIGVGEPLPRHICRAALFARIVELSSGRTGVSRAAIAGLVDLYNRGVTPVLPRHGSLGASDIGLVAHIVSVMLGHGEAWVGAARLPGAEALAAAGLAPVALEPKDGLGLISHGSVTIARAALVLDRVRRHLDEMVGIVALSFEGYRANPAILDARLHAARPAGGQEEAAARLRAALRGSYLEQPGAPAKIQDALCFREIAPVLGTALAALSQATGEVVIEMNGVTCSPLVLVEDGDMLSSPNFHPSSLTLALDALAIALTHAAWATSLRICKLMTASLSGLPKYLSPVGGASAGYVSLQKTTGSLYAAVRSQVAPVMLDALPVSDTVEDMAPFADLAADKLERILPLLGYLSAIEALAAAQAVDLRPEATVLGAGSAPLHAAIRAAVPPLAEDRPPGADVEAVRRVLDAVSGG